jgi:DNA-binding NtrC family response regulator
MRGRLLLVDDDLHIRIMLQAYLEALGYIVETAVNGRDALTKLGQADYDLVVTDYDMPEVDGSAVFRHIRQHQPSLPVVIMTGGGNYSITAVQSLVELGAQACLFKPFDLQKLEHVVTEALAKKSHLWVA